MIRNLVVTLTGVTVGFWALAVGFGLHVMHQEYSEIFDSGLRQTAERLLLIAVDDLAMKGDTHTAMELVEEKPPAEEHLTFQVRRGDGSVALYSHGAGAKAFDVPLEGGFAATSSQRIYTARSADKSIFVHVADALDHRREALLESGLALTLPLLLLLPVNLIAVTWATRRLLSPVNRLRAEIALKDGGNLAPLGSLSLPAELTPIARSVNLLLGRLRHALEAEREFIANSAHELRTPIAGALAHSQRLLAELPAEFKPRTRRIESALSHMAQLAEKLLQMSRAEAGIGVVDAENDLLPVLHLTLEDIERSSLGAGRLVFVADEGTSLHRPISRDVFAIVMRNVLENALIHSPAESRVELVLEREGRIRVVNDAAVVPPDELRKLTERFYRGPTTANGTGLGLSIVKRLVRQINGKLEILSPATGRLDGFEVRIEI